MDVTLTELRRGLPWRWRAAWVNRRPSSRLALVFIQANFLFTAFFDMSLIYQIKRTACNKSVCTIYNSIKRGQREQAVSTWESGRRRGAAADSMVWKYARNKILESWKRAFVRFFRNQAILHDKGQLISRLFTTSSWFPRQGKLEKIQTECAQKPFARRQQPKVTHLAQLK